MAAKRTTRHRHGNSGRTYVFAPGTNKLTGVRGWRPEEIAGFDPVNGTMIVHDLLEHFPGSEGGPANEYRAQGAMVWLRYNGGFFPQERRRTTAIADLVVPPAFGMLFGHIANDRHHTDPHPNTQQYVQRLDGQEEAFIAALVSRGTEHAHDKYKGSIDLLLESIREVAGWMRGGYRDCAARYRGLDPTRLAAMFKSAAEAVDRITDNALPYDAFEDGTEESRRWRLHLTAHQQDYHMDVEVRVAAGEGRKVKAKAVKSNVLRVDGTTSHLVTPARSVVFDPADGLDKIYWADNVVILSGRRLRALQEARKLAVPKTHSLAPVSRGIEEWVDYFKGRTEIGMYHNDLAADLAYYVAITVEDGVRFGVPRPTDGQLKAGSVVHGRSGWEFNGQDKLDGLRMLGRVVRVDEGTKFKFYVQWEGGLKAQYYRDSDLEEVTLPYLDKESGSVWWEGEDGKLYHQIPEVEGTHKAGPTRITRPKSDPNRREGVPADFFKGRRRIRVKKGELGQRPKGAEAGRWDEAGDNRWFDMPYSNEGDSINPVTGSRHMSNDLLYILKGI